MFDENDNGPDREKLLDKTSRDDLDEENDDDEMNAEETAETSFRKRTNPSPKTGILHFWLMNVQFDEKRRSVCFEFANNKTCQIM